MISSNASWYCFNFSLKRCHQNLNPKWIFKLGFHSQWAWMLWKLEHVLRVWKYDIYQENLNHWLDIQNDFDPLGLNNSGWGWRACKTSSDWGGWNQIQKKTNTKEKHVVTVAFSSMFLWKNIMIIIWLSWYFIKIFIWWLCDIKKMFKKIHCDIVYLTKMKPKRKEKKKTHGQY